MKRINATTAADFYKTGHLFQYPEGTEFVYSNFTPRSARLAPVLKERYDNKVVVFGMQGFIKWYLIGLWNETFFDISKGKAVKFYQRRVDNALGKGSVTTKHLEDLHDLGYLPIVIKALPEGSRVNIGVPMYTIYNTKPEFFWITNYLESVMSAELWKPCTTATLAYEYRKLIDIFAEMTGAHPAFSIWQSHDFSFRGMSGLHDAAQSGAGHLLSFAGTDTIPAIDYLEDYYGADSDKELIGGSVPASEHAVMSAGGYETEIETFHRLVTKVYPSGIVSIVSDTWDFWKVITEYTITLKQEILNRTPNALGLAKVVFRPDSGDPVKIICGDPDAAIDTPEYKGAVECLWDIFGGTETEKGYRILNERVGLIYGDSITLQRAQAILQGLAEKGFASCNIVFGVGSYTYQYVTRDSFGFAVKATFATVKGQDRELFKDPKTDSGVKKSAKGLLRVEKSGNDFVLHDCQTRANEKLGELKTVFENGKLITEYTLSDIRKRLGAF